MTTNKTQAHGFPARVPQTHDPVEATLADAIDVPALTAKLRRKDPAMTWEDINSKAHAIILERVRAMKPQIDALRASNVAAQRETHDLERVVQAKYSAKYSVALDDYEEMQMRDAHVAQGKSLDEATLFANKARQIKRDARVAKIAAKEFKKQAKRKQKRSKGQSKLGNDLPQNKPPAIPRSAQGGSGLPMPKAPAATQPLDSSAGLQSIRSSRSVVTPRGYVLKVGAVDDDEQRLLSRKIAKYLARGMSLEQACVKAHQKLKEGST